MRLSNVSVLFSVPGSGTEKVHRPSHREGSSCLASLLARPCIGAIYLYGYHPYTPAANAVQISKLRRYNRDDNTCSD